MEPTGCPETSVRNYRYWLRNKPEERSSQLLRGGSLKSLISCANKVVTLCSVELLCLFGCVTETVLETADSILASPILNSPFERLEINHAVKRVFKFM